MDKEGHGRWVTPIIPSVGKQRQDCNKFETTLVYIVNSKLDSLKLKKKEKKKKRKRERQTEMKQVQAIWKQSVSSLSHYGCDIL